MILSEKKYKIIKKIQSSFNEILHSKLLSNIEDDDNLLLEKQTNQEFYELVSSQGFQKDELFRIELPIELIDKKKVKNPYLIKMETEIPIDVTKLKDYIKLYSDAVTENSELYQKYKRMANWYSDFNKLILENLKESDAYLFLAAVAFCSANTALDVNIIEAAKLFRAVKIDFSRGQASRDLLRYLAINFTNVDDEKNIRRLAKFDTTNSSFVKLLLPKIDPEKQDIVREITVSGAKLGNFNDFILYYLDHNGKITKDEFISDIKTGRLQVSGTKIYSFLVNLVDPEFEWVSIDTTDYKGGKIQPATIDRWMIRIFFDRPLNKAIDELIKDGVIEEGKNARETFKNEVIKKLFSSDIVRGNIIKLMNETLQQYLKENPEFELKYAHQLQAFGWVLIRQEYNIPSAKFSSFEDVIQFTEKTSEKIDKINPELNFINKFRGETKNKVLTAIALISNIPRVKLKNSKETEISIKNWLKYATTTSLGEKTKKEKGEDITKYTITKPIEKDGKFETQVKYGKKQVENIVADSYTAAILAAKNWIRNHHKPEAIEVPTDINKVKIKKQKIKENIFESFLNEDIISEVEEFLKNYFKK